MPANEPVVEVSRFLGLRNKDRRSKLPIGSLVDAVNVDIDDDGDLSRRDGYIALSGMTGVTAAYATKDEKELYVVDVGILKRVISLDPLTVVALATGIGAGEVWWADDGGYIFCSGAVNGIIHADTFTPYSEFGSDDEQTLDAQGQVLNTDEADIGTMGPPDFTECVAFFEGSIWLTYYDTVSDQSFIFKSKPFFWSRWDRAMDFVAVPGHVLLLAPSANGIVIGTDKRIWAITEGFLQPVADYGVVGGQHDEDMGQIYFWTERGLCRGLPFVEITESTVSVPAGSRACVSVTRRNGIRQAIVVTTGGGTADNAYA